ncbi:protein FAM228A [Coregonus clupeaformis]|uniref:protein FAM228A n=1 Tax=Coregonus clupeaformis TaxID=59861 RepID=UPI001E1C498B|nr:protein FAM228A [Coregonus clupeaformis]
MPLKNRTSGAAGLIMVHTPAPLGLLTSTVAGEAVPLPTRVAGEAVPLPTKTPSGGWTTGRRGAGREKRRSEAWLPGPPRGPWVDWLSHTSFRRLQVKLESENQEARAITQPLLDTENGFVKDLERFLCQQERAEHRKRELLHKRWTERVWTPIQRSVEKQVSHCCYEEAERIRSMFLQYIHYCNSKGFVFLENYDPQEYNPFHLHINQPQVFTVSYTHSQVDQLLQHNLPHLAPPTDPMTSHPHLRSVDLPLLAPTTHRSSTPREPLVEVETALWRPDRPPRP